MKNTKRKNTRATKKFNNKYFNSKMFIFVLLFAIVGVYFLLRSFAATPNATEKMGVYRGSGKPESTAEYEQWVGRPVTYALDFLGGQPDDSTTPWATIDNPGWWCGRWAPSKYSPVFSVAILPTNKLNLAAGARGEYNAHWKKFAEVMVARGCGSDILRLGWEFNGAFYNWSISDKADGIIGNEDEYVMARNYAEYWRQIVKTTRQVPGANFKFDWCPLRGRVQSTQAKVEAAYPSGVDSNGRSYVDIIGLDSYDTSRTGTTPATRWSEQLNEELGLAWLKSFAVKQNKPISIPEWGLTVRPHDNLGGGDNPYYITKMFEWMSALPSSGAGSLAYHSYFEYDARDGAHRLMLGQFPNSAKEFKRLFGVLPTSTEPEPTPTPDPTPTPTPEPEPTTVSYKTVTYGATQSKYSSNSFYVTIPKTGIVKYKITSPQNARYDVAVYDSSGTGTKVSEKLNVSAPISESFEATITGNYRFYVKSKWWSKTSFTLTVTYPN